MWEFLQNTPTAAASCTLAYLLWWSEYWKSEAGRWVTTYTTAIQKSGEYYVLYYTIDGGC